MAPDRLRSLVVLCMAPLVIALSLPSSAWADPAAWNGEYTITFIVGPRSGSSIAAGQPEGQYTDTYAFRSNCANGNCTATIVSGPTPRPGHGFGVGEPHGRDVRPRLIGGRRVDRDASPDGL